MTNLDEATYFGYIQIYLSNNLLIASRSQAFEKSCLLDIYGVYLKGVVFERGGGYDRIEKGISIILSQMVGSLVGQILTILHEI